MNLEPEGCAQRKDVGDRSASGVLFQQVRARHSPSLVSEVACLCFLVAISSVYLPLDMRRVRRDETHTRC